MKHLSFPICIALAGIVVAHVPAAASTLEYTFSVPYEIKAVAGTGSAAGREQVMAVTCAIGPATLAYSTATNKAQDATGSGTTNNVSRSPATVVVTVDAEPRPANGLPKEGAGGKLQPTKPNGYYTCWGTFATGQTPVNFLPTTKLPTVTQGAVK